MCLGQLIEIFCICIYVVFQVICLIKKQMCPKSSIVVEYHYNMVQYIMIVTCENAMMAAKHASDFELTKDTP